ncbi:MAG: hypothetical protein ABR569_10045 [Gaiellaceae bacterium]
MLDRLKEERTRLAAGAYRHLRPHHLGRLAAAWTRDRRGLGAYRILSEEGLCATRSSDTAFVFGSGRSLLGITAEEWARISTFNTISLREFPRQHWVRADYHLTGEVDFLEEYARRLRENPLYADTVFVVMGGLQAHMGNELIGRRLLRPGVRVFRFRRRARWRYAPPSRTPRTLVHGPNSIFDAANLAYAMGYRRIVLAGADYYNKEYFWLQPGETRGYETPAVVATEQWSQAETVVEMMGRWRRVMAADGVELTVYNPRSLLIRELPVFSWR